MSTLNSKIFLPFHTLSKGFTKWFLEYIISPVVDAILPPRCPVCDELLQAGQRDLCTKCRADAPLTRFWLDGDNALISRINESVEQVVSASALLYYITESGWRKLVHRLKYHNGWRLGVTMGRWYGSEIKGTKPIQAVDFVIAIPLHPLRALSRGYNQADYIAEGIAEAIKVPHLRKGLKRSRYNVSQVTIPHHSRFLNTENLFEVTDSALFEGRDILLVDDVYTTGSTMLSCVEAILKAAPNCKIHIAALALSHKQFKLDKKLL